jgi:hypothetical protein
MMPWPLIPLMSQEKKSDHRDRFFQEVGFNSKQNFKLADGSRRFRRSTQILSAAISEICGKKITYYACLYQPDYHETNP